MDPSVKELHFKVKEQVFVMSNVVCCCGYVILDFLPRLGNAVRDGLLAALYFKFGKREVVLLAQELKT